MPGEAIPLLHQQSISLHKLELYLLNVPQKTSFVSGIGVRNSKETMIVKWEDQEGRIGYGECSCRPDPYYSAEFLSGGVQLIQKFIVPQLKPSQTYGELLSILGRIRGWPFTKAAVEAAAFQILRQQVGYQLSDELKAKPIQQIPVGISLGIYQDKQEMYEVVQDAIDSGYQRLKFKISPQIDTSLFDHINPLLFDNKVHVGFDANGSIGLPDLDVLGYFVETYSVAIEQPTPPGAFEVYQAAKQRFPQLKVCWDEEVKSLGDLVKLNALNSIEELNLKIGRVGGIANSIQILNYCFEQDIPCWIGGMFETGIGRLLNLEFASFLPHAKAHDLSPSSRYFKKDLISPEIGMSNGFVDFELAKKSDLVPSIMDTYTTEKIIAKSC